MGRVRDAWRALRGELSLTDSVRAELAETFVRREEVTDILMQVAEMETTLGAAYNKLNGLALTMTRVQRRREAEMQAEREEAQAPDTNGAASRAAMKAELARRARGVQ